MAQVHILTSHGTKEHGCAATDYGALEDSKGDIRPVQGRAFSTRKWVHLSAVGAIKLPSHHFSSDNRNLDRRHEERKRIIIKQVSDF